jgi:hypothetical protein
MNAAFCLEISTGDKGKNQLTIGSSSGKIKPPTFHVLDPKNVAKQHWWFREPR